MTEKLPGWVQKMMGHETLQMIHDRYYSYIKNYQRDDGSAFMEKVYQSFEKSGEEGIGLDDPSRKCAPNVPQKENGELVAETNSPNSLNK